MSNSTIKPVILAGGSGSRLWPLSRRSSPKQFAEILGQGSLFQTTVRRLDDQAFAAPMVMTGEEYRFIAAEQLSEAGRDDGTIVVEPQGRNTAPAVLIAALMMADEPDAVLLVCPSDHAIADKAAFRAAVMTGAEAASGGALVTFGVRPDRPEGGYGYLELDAPLAGGETGSLKLTSFVEKPGTELAAQLIAGGRHLWNSGIFMFRVDAIIAAFESLAPELMIPCRAALAKARRHMNFIRLDHDAYARADDISIDYALMEKATSLKAVPLDAGWTDLGSWRSVRDASAVDTNGNALSDNALAIDCRGSILRSEDPDIQVVGVGLENITAIATGDAVLVARVDENERIREVVATLKARKAKQAESFSRCHRPWGYYETLALGPRFQVKRIQVKPGAALSLQSHVHRAEHWVVVSGSARVTVGDEVRLMSENENVYIPLGAVHRLENPGKVPLNLIEVQSGSYLGEDDIVRYEDVYDRAVAA
jgi:mannose-1-phosphate guanylyltransferase / mannose-6-phosphate isomerase